ncbi:MAG: type II toxin-antitoxin system VapC family toxin [Planctomycetaceae bacterium]
MRRRRATGTDVRRAWSAFLEVPLRYVEIDVGRALDLAVEQRLYAYDAYVLEAARAARVLLLTLDHQQRRVAGRLGIELLEVSP